MGRLLTTKRIRAAVPAATHRTAHGSVAATRVLDIATDELAFADRYRLLSAADQVRHIYADVRRQVRPVYGLDEYQSASRTMARGRGSCSQRLAVVEAGARRLGVPTRVRGLVARGDFWHRRMGLLAFGVPARILLAWPEFFVDGEWRGADEFFPADPSAAPFTNVGAETLFDAIGNGTLRSETTCASGFDEAVLFEVGVFDSRDSLFQEYGQNMTEIARAVVDPLSSHWSAGAGHSAA